MTDHHVYDPWPMSNVPDSPCKFCGHGIAGPLHAVPLEPRGFAEPDRHDFAPPMPGMSVSPYLCTRCGEPTAAYIHRPPTPEPQRCPVDCRYRCHHTDEPPWVQRAVRELVESDVLRRAEAAEARIAAALEEYRIGHGARCAAEMARALTGETP